jgi:hypothetical protein
MVSLLSAAILLSSCTGGGGGSSNATTPEGVPTGTWRCVVVNKFPVGTATITGTLSILPDGRHSFSEKLDVRYTKSNVSIGMGLFRGRKSVSWSTQRPPGGKVARVGEKLFVYKNPNAKRLVSGDPPGYTLVDYRSLGIPGADPFGLNAAEKRGSLDDAPTVYSFKGRDLVLRNSTDGNLWLYKRVGN